MKKTRKISDITYKEDNLINNIKEKFYHFKNNNALARHFGISLHTVRRICYQLGLKRMVLEYFTKQQIVFLSTHYMTIGDSEMAEIFQRKWPKQKPWNKKHIEKKRNYLGYHRTREQIKSIHTRNVKNGKFAICPVKAWDKRGRAPEGEVRYWSHSTGQKFPVIKYQGKFVHWCRWAWKKYFGMIPTGKKVVFKDGNPYHLSPDNLELLSHAELARRNAVKSSQNLSNNYIAGLLTPRNPSLRQIIKQQIDILNIKRKQLTLKRTIYEQQTNKIHAGKHGR